VTADRPAPPVEPATCRAQFDPREDCWWSSATEVAQCDGKHEDHWHEGGGYRWTDDAKGASQRPAPSVEPSTTADDEWITERMGSLIGAGIESHYRPHVCEGDSDETCHCCWVTGQKIAPVVADIVFPFIAQEIAAARDAELAKLRVPEHIRGDGPCTTCGTVDNIIWFTDNVLWNEVCRQGDDWPGVLCIPCFIARVDAHGLRPTGWRLQPDWHWETTEERAARRGDS
jgi:hypothetical protein